MSRAGRVAPLDLSLPDGSGLELLDEVAVAPQGPIVVVLTAAARRIRVRLSEDAHKALAAYDWPGNVRELKNVIERSAVIRGEGVITAGDLDLAAPRHGIRWRRRYPARRRAGKAASSPPWRKWRRPTSGEPWRWPAATGPVQRSSSAWPGRH